MERHKHFFDSNRDLFVVNFHCLLAILIEKSISYPQNVNNIIVESLLYCNSLIDIHHGIYIRWYKESHKYSEDKYKVPVFS